MAIKAKIHQNAYRIRVFGGEDDLPHGEDDLPYGENDLPYDEEILRNGGKKSLPNEANLLLAG